MTVILSSSDPAYFKTEERNESETKTVNSKRIETKMATNAEQNGTVETGGDYERLKKIREGTEM